MAIVLLCDWTSTKEGLGNIWGNEALAFEQLEEERADGSPDEEEDYCDSEEMEERSGPQSPTGGTTPEAASDEANEDGMDLARQNSPEEEASGSDVDPIVDEEVESDAPDDHPDVDNGPEAEEDETDDDAPPEV